MKGTQRCSDLQFRREVGNHAKVKGEDQMAKVEMKTKLTKGLDDMFRNAAEHDTIRMFDAMSH